MSLVITWAPSEVFTGGVTSQDVHKTDNDTASKKSEECKGLSV